MQTVRRFLPSQTVQYESDHWKEQGAIRFIHAADYDAIEGDYTRLEALLRRVMLQLGTASKLYLECEAILNSADSGEVKP